MKKNFFLIMVLSVWIRMLFAVPINDFRSGHIQTSETVVQIGSSIQLVAIEITNPIWSSRNELVATVDQTGLVTGIAEGFSYICCYSGIEPIDSVAIYVYGGNTLIISSVSDFCNFRDAVNAGEGIGIYKGVVNNDGFSSYVFLLSQNLDLSSVCNETLGSWIPIGTKTNPFKSHFIGSGHTISNLYIQGNQKNQGLFGNAIGAIIEKINLVSGNVTGSSNVGAIVGAFEASNLSYCTNYVNVFASDTCGGLVGLMDNGSFVQNCLNLGNVTGIGSYFIGGICGLMTNGGSSILNCVNAGTVIGVNRVGGIVGGINKKYGSTPILQYCLSYGKVEATYNPINELDVVYVGAIYGNIANLSKAYYCYSDKQMCTVAVVGKGINLGNNVEEALTDELTGMNPSIIAGFSSEQWVFSENKYPCPRGIENVTTSIVASSPMFLDHIENEFQTVKNVYSNFRLSLENGVDWSSSKENIIAINGNTAAVSCVDFQDSIFITTSKDGIEKMVRVDILLPKIYVEDDQIMVGDSVFVYLRGTCSGLWRCTNNSVLSISQISSKVLKVKSLTVGQAMIVFESESFSDSLLISVGINKITIENVTELALFRDAVNAGTSYQGVSAADGFKDVFVEVDQINVFKLSLDGAVWEPIGTATHPFRGIFSSNVIYDLNIEGNQDTMGFFGYLDGAVIKDFGIGSSFIHSDMGINPNVIGNTAIGAIAGSARNTRFINCTNAVVVKGNSNVGGLVGIAENCVFDECLNTGTVIVGENYGGGIAGLSNSLIQNCMNSGLVISDSVGEVYIGGICGKSSGIIRYCLNTSQIGLPNKPRHYQGGICGDATGSVIEKCIYDRQLSPTPLAYVVTNATITQSDGKLTFQMLGDSLISTFNEPNKWTFTPTYYPFLTKYNLTSGAQLSSSVLSFNAPDCTVDSVGEFSINTFLHPYGGRWNPIWWCNNEHIILPESGQGDAIVSCIPFDESNVLITENRTVRENYVTKAVVLHFFKSIPKGIISGDTAIYVGNSTQITIDFEGNPPFYYQISGDTTNYSTNDYHVVHTVFPSTTTIYTITSLKNNECVSRDIDLQGGANVRVSNGAIPIVVDPFFYCQYDEAAPLSVTESVGTLYWSTTCDGPYSIEAPIPSTEEAGYFDYYVYYVYQVDHIGGIEYLSDTAVVLVVVNAEPNTEITGKKGVEAGGTTTLYAEEGYLYEWYETEYPEILLSTSDSLTISPSEQTNYSVVISSIHPTTSHATFSNINIGDIITQNQIIVKPEQLCMYFNDTLVPVGVVFAKDSVTQTIHVLSLDEGQSIPWGFYETNIPNVPNISNAVQAEADMNGREITDALIAFNNTFEVPLTESQCAAVWARSKGADWYLPSAGELVQAYQNKDVINATIAALPNNNPLFLETNSLNRQWTSTSYSNILSWYVYHNGTLRFGNRAISQNSYKTRAIRSFDIASIQVLKDSIICSAIADVTVNICSNDSVNLVDTTCSGIIYTNYGFNVAIPASFSGDRIEVLNLYNQLGCDSVITINLYVRRNADLSVSGNMVLCGGDSTLLTATGGDSYEWYEVDDPSTILSNTSQLWATVHDSAHYIVSALYGNYPLASISDVEVGDYVSVDNVLIKAADYAMALEQGKIIIGVVFNVNAATNSLKIVSLTEATNIPWAFYQQPIPNLNFINSQNEAQYDMNGKANTDAIISYNQSLHTPLLPTQAAAVWARSLGDEWNLPASGEMFSIYNQISVINNSIAAIGQAQILPAGNYYWYWTSSAYSYTHAWSVRITGLSNNSGRTAAGQNCKIRATRNYNVSSLHLYNSDPIFCQNTLDVILFADQIIDFPDSLNLCSEATVSFPYLARNEIVWTSSDTTVLKISSTGDFFGVAVGTAYGSYITTSGCYDSVLVNVLSAPNIVTPDETEMCVGNVLFLQTTGERDASWYTSDETIATVSDDGKVLAVAQGSVYIYLAAINGCTDSILINVHPILNGIISGPQSVCEYVLTQTYQFQPAATYETLSYEWSVEGGIFNQNTQNFIIVTWNETASEHRLLLTVTDQIGCFNTFELSVTINPPINISVVTPDVFIENDTIDICISEPLSLTVEPSGLLYLWNKPSGIDSTKTIVLEHVSLADTGWYRITLEQETCTEIDSVYVNVKSNQGAPYGYYEVFYGAFLEQSGTIQDQIDTLVYASDLYIVFSNLTAGENVSGCGFESRYNLPITNNTWSQWVELNPNTNTVIDRDFITTGLHSYQIRHTPECASQFCGEPQVQNYQFFVIDSNIFLRGTADIDQMKICKAQESVTIRNIYSNSFNSEFQRIETQTLYYNYTGGNLLYSTPWTPLTYFGQQFDDSIEVNRMIYPILLDSIPRISVLETSNGIMLNAGNVIVSAGRIASIESIEGNDTTWSYSISNNTSWEILEDPYFTGLFDQYVCANDRITLTVQPNLTFFTTYTNWQYASNESSEFTTLPSTDTTQTTDLFSYYNESLPNNTTLNLFDFVHNPDTISIAADLSSIWVSCPIFYDTITVYVSENQHITQISGNNEQTVCSGNAIEEIVYRWSGGANGVEIEWMDNIPEGLTLTLENDLATISGIPTESGTFDYSLITVGENSCFRDTAVGSIIALPNAQLVWDEYSGDENQNVCPGIDIIPINYYFYNSGDFSYLITGLPEGIDYTLSDGIIVLSGNTLLSGTFEYMITTTEVREPCSNDTVRGSFIIPEIDGAPLAFNVSASGTGCSVMNGAIEVKATGGKKPYLYSISDVQGVMYSISSNDSIYTFYNLLSNRPYWVSVMDSNLCEIAPQNPITLTHPITTNLAFSVLQYGSGCEDGAGIINVQAIGGVAPYTFKLYNGTTTVYSEPIYENSYSFTGLSIGEFYFTGVKDANMCEKNHPIPILLPSLPMFTLDVSVVDYGSGCTEGDGFIKVSLIGGVAPFIYKISDGTNEFSVASNDTVYVFDNLSGGVTYFVSVQDANLCLQEVPMPITLPLLAVNALSMEIINVGSGCVDGEGYITVHAQGGTPPYIYQLHDGFRFISDPTYDTVYTFRNLLLEHVYLTSVLDAASCHLYLPDTIVLPSPPEVPLQLSLGNFGAGCVDGEGSITVYANGGIAPYIYKLNYANTTIESEPIFDTVYQFTNLSLNTYNVSVEDGIHCETALQEGAITLSLSPTPLMITDTLKGTGCSYLGFIRMSADGGVKPYTYLLYNSDTTIVSDPTYDSSFVFQNLNLAHTYFVGVLDHNLCAQTSNEIVFERPDTLRLFVNDYGSGCLEGEGEINISLTGGISPYIYRVYQNDSMIFESNPVVDTNFLFTNLNSGVHYEMSVMGAYLCEIFVEGGVVLSPLSDTPLSLTIENYGSGCELNSGTINVKAIGGSLPYIYTLFDGTTTISSGYTYDTLYEFSGLISETTYVVSVFDSNRCEIITKPITIPHLSDDPLNGSIVAFGSGCYDGNGSIEMEAIGGQPPYVYKIYEGPNVVFSNPTMSNIYTFENLNMGIRYYLSIIDDNLCEIVLNDGQGLVLPEVSEIQLMMDSVVTINGCGSVMASISMYVSGGSGSYQYLLDDQILSEFVSDSMFVFTNVSTGSHTITVKDSYFCNISQIVEVKNSENPLIVVTPNHSICNGSSTELSVLWGASTDFVYQWSINGTVVSTEPTFLAIPSVTSTYILLVSDTTTGCDTTCSVVVSVSEAPEIVVVSPNNLEIENDTLYICESFALSLSIEPVRSQYEWVYPNGSSSNQIITIGNFGANNIGWYKVTVNQNNCYAEDSIYVTTRGIQGTPYATVSFYRGDIFEHTQLTPHGIDSIIYSSNLNVIISDPVAAPNVEDCGFEYRLYYTANEGWTEWTDWIAYTEPVNISSENLTRIGYTTVQLRHNVECASQFCGDVLLYEYSFCVLSADTMLQSTPLVNEPEICQAQENVYMTNIYKLFFNSSVSRYEYQFQYQNQNTEIYYSSSWIPLSSIGQVFEDTLSFDNGTFALMIPSTPPISVRQTPDGQTVHQNNMIHAQVRVAMINSIDPITHDTMWITSDFIHYSWTIIPNPSFSPLLDFEACVGSDHHVVDYAVDYYYRPDLLSVSWYYSNSQTDTFTLIPPSETLAQTDAFTYWNAEAFPYNRVISLYDFSYSPDTVSVIAELSTEFSSCPIVRDTAMVYVNESHQLIFVSENDSQRVCQNSPIDDMIWELGGGADSAIVVWQQDIIPIGIDLSIEDNYAILNGTSEVSGVFNFTIYTIGSFIHDHYCVQQQQNGTLIIKPNLSQSFVYDTTCQSHQLYTSVLYPRFSGIDVSFAGTQQIDSIFSNIYGCDSSVTLLLTVNESFTSDTIFETTCQSLIPYTSSTNSIFHDLDVSHSGIFVYDSIFKTIFGCDSIITLELMVYPIWEPDTVNDATCKSSLPYTSDLYPEFGELDVSESGVFFYDTIFSTQNGCDSIVTLRLTVVVPYATDTIHEVICQSDEPFTSQMIPDFHDLNVSEFGVFYYDSTYHTTERCDSTVVLQLTVNPVYETTTIYDFACQSDEPYTSAESPRFTGIDVSQVGVQIIDSVFKTQNGCDSSVTLHLQVNPTYHLVFYDSICQGEIYRDHGFVIPASIAGNSRYIRSGNTVSGCDSIVTLWLSVFPAYSAPILQYICEGESYVDDNFVIVNPEAGVYRDTAIFETNSGCDSVIRLILIVQPLPEIVSSIPIVNDTVYACTLDALTLTATPNGANSYHWSFHGPQFSGSFIENQTMDQSITTNISGISVPNEGWYVVTTEFIGCIGKDSVYVKPIKHQSEPTAIFNVYRGNEFVANINDINNEDSVMYSPDLHVVVSHPVNGQNLLAPCDLEYRYYLAFDDQWTPWTLWSDTSLPINISNEAIQIGNMQFELRHVEECASQNCGSIKTKHFLFVITPTPEMLHGTQDIDQMFICMAQDSVRITDIYKWYFDNQISVYQYQSEYRRNGETYSSTEWMPLTELHQMMDTVYFGDTLYAFKVTNTPFVSVQTAANGEPTMPDDQIRINIRIATAEVIGNDTSWSFEPTSRFLWSIVSNPHFNNFVLDQNVCKTFCTNENPIKILMEIDEISYPEWVTWYYAPNASQDYQEMLSSYEIINNEWFSYRRAINEIHRYNNDVVLFDFSDEVDSLRILSELRSSLRSCPVAYDEFTVYVQPDHNIEVIQNELYVDACIDKPLDTVMFRFEGGASGAVFSWMGTIPTGLIYQNQEGYGFISGTPTLLGTFPYRLISTSDHSINDCKVDTLYGEITTHRNYIFQSEATICEGQTYQWKGRSLTESGIYYDSLENYFGCDSIYKLTLVVNPFYDSTIFAEICEGENYIENGFNIIQPVAGEIFDSLHLTTTKSCDSIVRLNLTIHSIYQIVLTENICYGEDYRENGFEIINPPVGDTIQTKSFVTSSLCDSIVTLMLHVNPVFETEIFETLCQGESYNFFGQHKTQPGIYTHHLQTVEGCDSIIILHLNFRPSYNIEVDAAICPGGSYMFGVYELTEDGIYSLTMTSQYGCDSTVTLNLEIDNSNIIPIVAEICEGESYIANGFEIVNPEVGTHYDSLYFDGQLCDSILALTLHVYQPFITNIEDAFCEGEVYEFLGQRLTEPGIYETTLSSMTNNNCDSTIILNLFMNLKDITTVMAQIPQGGSYNFYDEILTEPGIYEHHFLNSLGCDSMIVLNLSYGNAYQKFLNASICQGTVYEFGPYTLTESGIYVDSMTASNGYDSIIILTLVVHPVYLFEDTFVSCSNDPYMWHGRIFTESGIYWDSLQTQNGCDSLFKLTLSLNPLYFFSESRTVCGNEPHEWRGHFYTESGTYWDSLTTNAGCDSVYQLILNLYPSYLFEEVQDACDNEVIEWRGQLLSESGSYFDVYQTIDGCDSMYQLNLNMHPTFEITDAVLICDEEFYEWHGRILNESGFYVDSVSTMAGCDSICHLDLQFNTSFFSAEEVVICQEIFLWHNQILSESGIYWDSLQTAAGCDSVYQLNLEIHGIYINHDSLTICEGDSVYFDGTYLHEAGFYSYTIFSASGCDSMFNLTLFVDLLPEVVQIDGSNDLCPNIVTSYTATIENTLGYLWTIPETFSIIQGQGTETIMIQMPDNEVMDDIQVQGFNECGYGEITSFTITVHPNYETSFEDSTCQGVPYNFNGQLLTTEGLYTTVYSTVYGCDSIVQLYLSILPAASDSIIENICENETYNFNGTILNETGIYYDTLQLPNGCDSIVILNLTVTPLPNAIALNGDADFCSSLGLVKTYTATIFNAQSYHWDVTEGFEIISQNENSAEVRMPLTETIGTISVYGENSCGISDLMTMDLNVHSSYHITYEDGTCEGEMYYGYGFMVYASDEGLLSRERQLVASNGCDSIITLMLTVHPKYNHTVETQLCQGDSIEFNGIFLKEAGIYQATFESVFGCDSTVTLKISLALTYNITTSATICFGESYNFGGDELTETGTYVKKFISYTYHCDSIVTLNLNVIPLHNFSYADTMCEGDTYEFYEELLTQPGVYTKVLTSTTGCDSIIILTLSIAQPDIPKDVIATNVEGKYVYVTWNAFADAYAIYRDGNFVATATENSHSDSSVIFNDLYCYSVKSLIADCESELSEEFCILFQNPDMLYNVYPNPTKNEVTVVGEDMQRIVISSITRTYFEIVPDNPSFTKIDVSRFESGIYFMRIFNSMGNEVVKRFIILR